MTAMRLHFYADEESIAQMASEDPKALLIGGDLGYGNFGDVLQHIGSARHAKAEAALAVVSVFALDALSRQVDAAALRRMYAVDALLFAAMSPLTSSDAGRLGLRPVTLLRNVSLVHLYGGGYLNALWGDFMLGIAGHFLGQLPGVPYVMSGQQLSSGFERQAREHVEAFKPRLVGMRDRASLSRAHAAGIAAEFCFDDAVEPLLGLRDKLELRRGEGVFIHLNTSGYTGNDAAVSEIAADLRDVAARLGRRARPVLLQAFQDAREDVVDTIETVKRLETGFPFSDVETALLVRAVLSEVEGGPCILQGLFGYSSSYHVTLWLQLHGIPCWLRGNNEYYAQKREALGVHGNLQEFLERMPAPDHGENLHARARWRAMLGNLLGTIPGGSNRIQWALPDEAAAARAFHFKGEPRFGQKLQAAWHEQERLGVALEEADARLRAALDEAQAAQVALEDAEGRLRAYEERITEIGSEARRYREASLQAQARLQEAERREREASSHLQEILGSRTWRWTRSLRAGARFIRTGRFDREGHIGLFAIAQIVGRKLPIPAHWRSAIGLRLQRLRRR